MPTNDKNKTKEIQRELPPPAGDSGLRPCLATILFLGANPSDDTRLALDSEWRGISQNLQRTPLRDRFQLIPEWAIRAEDLQSCLLRNEPMVVHFSGLGSPEGEICVVDDHGRAFPLSREALSDLFRILRGNIRCVVLNACYSAAQADEIARHIDCVVGMSAALAPGSARAFAGAFYRALGHGESVKVAFDLGCNEIDLHALEQADVPRLIPRAGIQPEEVILVQKQQAARRGAPR
jgi:hypothetical protein